MRLPGMQAVNVLAGVLLAAALTAPARANEKVYAEAVHGTVLILTADGSSGTGVLVDADLRLVVTANHVPSKQDKVIVVLAEFDAKGRVIAERAHYFADGRPQGGIEAAVIVRSAECDLAVLQLATLPAGAVALPLAADSAAPGAAVHMIGNACLARNAVFGTRSGKVDSVYQNEPTPDFPMVAKVVATSIATNKGDSGGPVLNDEGKLVGIVSSGTICWGTAKLADPANEEKLAEHPLARQQSVNLSIDVTEVRVLIEDARRGLPAAERQPAPAVPVVRGGEPLFPRRMPPAKPARSLVGGRWACSIRTDRGVCDIEGDFRADGTYRLTASDADGVLINSERGKFTCAEGQLTFNPDDGRQTSLDVTWTGDDEVTMNAKNPVVWARR